MTLVELLYGDIQSGNGTAIFQAGAQSEKRCCIKGGYNDFDSILRGISDDASGRRSAVKKDIVSSSDGKKNTETAYLSFREANKAAVDANNRTRPEKSASGAVREADNALKSEENEKKSPGKKPDYAVNIIAQLLGLDIVDFQKLLKEAGITAEELIDSQCISGSASELSQLLCLNSLQQETLERLIRLAVEALDTCANGKLDESSQNMIQMEIEPNTDTIKADNGKIPDASSTPEPLAAKLKVIIGESLNDLANKLASDQSAVEAEVDELMLSVLQTAGRSRNGNAAAETGEPLQLIDAMNNAERISVNTEAAQEDISGEGVSIEEVSGEDIPEEDSDSANNKVRRYTGTESIIRESGMAAKGTGPQAAFTVIKLENTSYSSPAGITDYNAPVAAREILGQIIEQARVILTPDKSEMLIDLKPDSLGKISLKVVTENSIVMAKFTAESEQVKQVLEANMQLLKESMQKQGLLVQGLTVSVRQDSGQSAGQWAQPENKGNGNVNAAPYRTADIRSNLSDVFDTAGNGSLYQWGYSTIDLTA